jgi:hypothetical protein
MNTGVMLMNIDRLRESLPEFREYILQNLAELERESWTKRPTAGSTVMATVHSGIG